MRNLICTCLNLTLLTLLTNCSGAQKAEPVEVEHPASACPYFEPPPMPQLIFNGQLCLSTEDANELLQYGKDLKRWFGDWHNLCEE